MTDLKTIVFIIILIFVSYYFYQQFNNKCYNDNTEVSNKTGNQIYYLPGSGPKEYKF